MRLLSPCDSPDTITTVAGADDTSAGDATELRWELNEDLSCCYVLFLVDQLWSPVGTTGDLAFGVYLPFLFRFDHSRSLSVFG